MPETIRADAYLIRHAATGQVLHMSGNESRVTCEPRDENSPNAREKQTWWIEPIPEHEVGEKDDALYTITNIAYEQSFDAQQLAKQKGNIKMYKSHGAPWQLWKIVRITDRKDGEFYQILSLSCGLAIDKVTQAKGAPVHFWEPCTENSNQVWELVIPICSIPVGWHHIKNVATGHILKHTYPSSPVRLGPQTFNTVSSNHYQTWGTQWAIIQGHEYSGNTSQWTFEIRNRLSGGYLRCVHEPSQQLGPFAGKGVNAWQTTPDCSKLWTFDLDGRKKWKIVDEATGCLLAEDPQTGTPVCCSKGPDRWKSWCFVPVADLDAEVKQEKNNAPPNYMA
ncbi:hypothetical protein FN846DRAFT_526619 [Sphaerosporella brunnea]|uniref:Ricin B lectin domain-containing protein n=1 Tax=Sphaerosporella brunnea TaxID=1250544 RepID=A0A5J5F3U1_9PEZI|nr:hypothetical protein FN846DRAFT_526619 [Sphaerosporella brunnea]